MQLKILGTRYCPLNSADFKALEQPLVYQIIYILFGCFIMAKYAAIADDFAECENVL